MSAKTLLVTGGAGFIGTNFVRQVLAERPEWRIVNLDALTYAGNLANFQDLTPEPAARHRFVHGAIQDERSLGANVYRRNFCCCGALRCRVSRGPLHIWS